MKRQYYYKNNPIVKSIFLKMLTPTILMNLTTALASFADTVIIGHFLDDLSLSVVTFATPLYMIINTFAALFAVGGSIAMSIDSGKGSRDNANRAFSVSVELLLFTGIILLLSGIFLGKQITGWLGAGKAVFDMVQDYSVIVLVFAPIFMLNVGLAFFVRNDGRPTLSMVGMFLSIAVNIVLDIVFIGVCDWGVKGAAFATVLGQLVSVLVISTHFFSARNTLRFRFAFGKIALRIVKNGSSTALHFIYQFITILILNHFIEKLAGTSGVVVYTVVFNLYTVSLAMFEGISQTIQPMVSLYVGEKSYAKIRNTMRLAFVAIIIICGLVTCVLEIVPGVVPRIFGIEGAMIIQQSETAVRIFAVSMIIMTVNVVLGYYLQSTEHSVMAAILVSLRCFALFLGSTLVLGKIFGMNGLWGAYAVAEVLTFVIYIVMNRIMRRKLRRRGVNTNYLLLDTNVENKIICLTYSVRNDNFYDFKANVMSNVDPDMADSVKAYLDEIEKCIIYNKNRFIEAEINGAEGRIIIRDNLNHEMLPKETKKEAGYGPVLGWNRMCFERG